MNLLSRRSFLERGIQAGLATSVFAGAAFARERAKIVSLPLAGDLNLITGAGCNVLALRSADGLLLVDGGLKEHASAVLKAAGKGRIHTLINTHWHPEAIGLNERAGRSGATIIAHENTRLWLSRPIQVGWRDKPFAPLPERSRPNKTTYTTDTVSFAGEEIEYGYMRQAHTDGDLYVYFRKANVLATGGVVSSDGWPLLDYETGGWIGGLVAGYDKLLRVANAETRIVPGNGPMITRADLEAHRKMYFTLYERAVAGLNKALGPDEVIATQPAKEFAAQWGNPDAFVDHAFRSLWGHFAPDA